MNRRKFLKSSAAIATISMASTSKVSQAQQMKNMMVRKSEGWNNIILLTNGTGWAGIDKTAEDLKNGTYCIDAMIEGIKLVDA